MSAHHEEEGGHGGHHGGGSTEWIATNMSGIIMPFGKGFEWFAEHIMFLLVNHFVRRVGIVYLVIVTPILLLEFLVSFVHL